jgi:group I intron endonuclease
MIVVYKILNTINNKFYIGSTIHFTTRKREHIYALKHKIHRNSLLQRAWDKYGEENFKFEILEILDTNADLKKILETEQKYLDLLLPYEREIGYNLNPVAGSNLGFKMPESAKEKLKIINTGKKHSLETRRRISEIQKGKKRKFSSKLLTSQKCRHENNPSAKLNWEKVREIRKKKQEGMSGREIAKLFNIAETNVSSICNYKTWKEGDYYVDTNKSD